MCRPDQDHNLALRGRVATTLAVAALAAAAGCGTYGRAEVLGLCASPRGAGAHTTRTMRVHRVSVDNAVSAGRASMALLNATLGLAGATGSPRLARSALTHFELADDAPERSPIRTGRVVIDITRDDGLGRERWVVDSTWILRRLAGGALVARQGDFREVLSALALIMPELENGAAPRAR